MSRLSFTLLLLLVFIFNPALADDDDDERRSKPVINQVQVDGTSIFVYGNELIKNGKDKVFFAAESSSRMIEVPFTKSGDDFLEITLPYQPDVGTYRLGVGKSEKKLRISELITFGPNGKDEAAACPNAPYDMVAYWSFDKTITEFSGGMGESAVGELKFADGKFSESLDLSGTNDYVVIPDRKMLFFNNDEAFSISIWFKPLDDNSGFIFLKNAGYGIKWESSGSAMRYYNGSYHSGNRDSWTLGDWSHLVLVDDGSRSTKLYVNGELDSLDTNRNPNRFRSIEDYIFPTAVGGWFEDRFIDQVNGLVDDFAFFNRSLSDAEVAQIYNSGDALCTVE